MRHEPSDAFKPTNEAPLPSDLLPGIRNAYGFGPLQASASYLVTVADSYEQWTTIARYGGAQSLAARDSGDREKEKRAELVADQACRQSMVALRELCAIPAMSIEDLGRKARIVREVHKEWWEDGGCRLARSLVADILRLAGMAAPELRDLTPADVVDLLVAKGLAETEALAP